MSPVNGEVDSNMGSCLPLVLLHIVLEVLLYEPNLNLQDVKMAICFVAGIGAVLCPREESLDFEMFLFWLLLQCF